MQDKIPEVIGILKGDADKPVSGVEIGITLGVSRTMVWKYVQALRQRGYSIESIAGKGYVLHSLPDLLYPERISDGLSTVLIGKEIVYCEKTESTNDLAKQIGNKTPDGTVVIAETQDSGRGRRGSVWYSPEGGIWLSVILKPSLTPSQASRLTLMAGVAVAKALHENGVNASLKWPNDVLVNGKKICGILTEMDAEAESINYVVIGIGINANVEIESLPEDIRVTSTTLKAELGGKIDRVAFVRSLLYEFEQQYIRFNARPFDEILSSWTDFSDTPGRQVKLITPSKTYEGKAIGVSEDGGLTLEMKNGVRKTLISGSCIYI